MPKIRSGHLTEALAFGLGFDTNAALRASIAGETGKPPALADAKPGQFVRRLEILRHSDIAADAFLAAMHEEVLDETPYTRFRKGDHAANDRHYHNCKARNRPVMMVKMARQYAKLEWTCIMISDCDDHVSGPESNEFVRIMFRLFQERAGSAQPPRRHAARSKSIGECLPLL